MTQVFICDRGAAKTVKVQLELRPDVLEAYKAKSKEFQEGKYTAKQIMENVLQNHIDGVVANG